MATAQLRTYSTAQTTFTVEAASNGQFPEVRYVTSSNQQAASYSEKLDENERTIPADAVYVVLAYQGEEGERMFLDRQPIKVAYPENMPRGDQSKKPDTSSPFRPRAQ
jgi:hypothetical protein